MKKFYAFAAAALATMSMSAQLYVVGNGDGLGWEPTTPLEVALTDGAYTFEVTNLIEFKMSTAKGDWATFNNASYYATINKADLGTAVALESMEGIDNPGNIAVPWKGDYKLVVAADLSTITATTTTPEPDPTAAKVIVLRGSMNNWGNDGAADTEEFQAVWGFSKVTDTEYVWEGTLTKGDMFKVADPSWGAINYGAGDGAIIYNDDDTEWAYNVEGGTMAEDFDGTITITLPEVERTSLAIVFAEGAGVANIAVENGVAEYFNLQGVRVANPENGLFIVRKAGKTAKVVL